MAKSTDFADAARLLSQAATSLINSALVNGQTAQTSSGTSSGTSRTGQDQTRPARAQEEFRRLFPSCSQGQARSRPGPSSSQRRSASNTSTKAKKRKTVKEVTVKFFCLASTVQQDVPTNEEKQQLIVAGLGEKKLTVPAETNANDVRVALKEGFPKLNESGGYEFMYAKPSSRELNVIGEGQDGYTIEFLKRFVGQGRVYVRPIQSDLDLSPETTKENPGSTVEEICNYCLDIFPMKRLREHINVCPGKKIEGDSLNMAREQNNQSNCEVIDLDKDEGPVVATPTPQPSKEEGPATIVHNQTPQPRAACENTDFDFMYASLIFEDLNADHFTDEQVEEDATKLPEMDKEIIDIKDILHELAVINIDTENISKFNICRSNIWDGVKRGMARKSFSPKKKVSVKFTDDVGLSEGAVDMGGPMREFFTLALEKVLCGQLFCGPEQQRLLSYNAKALKEEEYFMAGQLFSMSLVHSGVGPRCLSPVLFDSLVKGPNNVAVSVDAVDDPDLQSGLQGLISVQSVEEAHAVIASKKLDRILELAGTLRLMKNVCDVKDVAIETAHWYVLGRTRPALESFKNGLNCLGLLDAVLLNPASFHSAMCFCPQVLSADTLHELFTVCRSEEGSNRWELENRILAFWRDLLLDIEEAESEITLSDILFFSSGLKVVPCHRTCMELEFLHDPEANGELSNFPKANTCSCVLYLPVTHSEYDSFKKTITFAIQNTRGFGIA